MISCVLVGFFNGDLIYKESIYVYHLQKIIKYYSYFFNNNNIN